VRAPVTAGERLVSADTEIRLTYRELQGLIEDAIRALR
jgi:hypothetical protein